MVFLVSMFCWLWMLDCDRVIVVVFPPEAKTNEFVVMIALDKRMRRENKSFIIFVF